MSRKKTERGFGGAGGGFGGELFNGGALVLLVAAVFVALFFAVAFSHFDNALKVGLCLADLLLCGVAVHKLTGAESYYGVLLLRGETGFSAMTRIAQRFQRACVWLADFGLAIGFGLPYAAFARKKQGGSFARFAWQAVAAAAFFAFVFLFSSVGIANFQGAVFFVLTAATGLFGFSFYFLAEHALRVLTVAQTPPGVMPVVPGVTLPIEAIVAIAIIAVVHEAAHGVLCEIVGLRLKSSGALLLGWLPIGAFVEPDEEAFKRLRLRDKRRILVAGSTSNALFFVFFFFLYAACFAALPTLVASVQVESTLYPSLVPQGAALESFDASPAESAAKVNSELYSAASRAAGGYDEVWVKTKGSETVFIPPTALVVLETKKGMPAEGVLSKGEVVYSVDGKRVATVESLKAVLAGRRQGGAVTLATSEGEKKIVLGANGAVGAVFSQETAFSAADVALPGWEWLYSLAALLLVIFYYTFVLNFVFASVNLLPIFITDGQRVFFEEFTAAFGKRKGALFSVALGVATVALLVVNALPWKTALGY